MFFRDARDLAFTLCFAKFTVQVRNKEVNSQKAKQTTELLLQFHLCHPYFFCSRTFTLPDVQDEECFAKTTFKNLCHLKCCTEVSGLTDLHNTDIIRTTLDDSPVACSCARVLGLVVDEGLTVNNNLACSCRSFYNCLRQSFEGFKITDELTDTSASIRFTIDRVKSERNPSVLTSSGDLPCEPFTTVSLHLLMPHEAIVVTTYVCVNITSSLYELSSSITLSFSKEIRQ